MSKYLLIGVFFIFTVELMPVELNYEDLIDKCKNIQIETEYDFGIIITNPQDGEIKFVYNENLIFNETFCPGSLLKPFAVIAVSRNHKIDPVITYRCTGWGKEIKCWLKNGHKTLNLIEAIQNSCNYYFFYFNKNMLERRIFSSVMSEFKLADDDFKILSDNLFYKTALGLGNSIRVEPYKIIFAYNAIFNGGRIFNRENILTDEIQINADILKIIKTGMKLSYLSGTSKLAFEKSSREDFIAKTGTGASMNGEVEDFTKNTGWIIVINDKSDFSMLTVVKESGSAKACEITGELLK
jgi:cell division protein FtsI/penicillin-binding protein 2